MFCPQCGTKLVEGSRFCYRCGCRLADYIPELGETHPSGTGARQAWGQQQAAAGPAQGWARPESPQPEQEDAQPKEPQENTSLRGPVILIDLSHKERIHEDHWSALRERLREEGRVAIRSRRPVNPALLRSKKMLLIGAPEHRWVFGRGADRWQDEEVRAIERFVARGNALWVMGDGLCDAEALSEVTLPYGVKFCMDPVGGVTISGKDLCRHRLTHGLDGICLGSVRGVGGNYLQVEDPATVLAEHNGRPVLAYCEHKDGRVVVLSSLSAFSQRHIGEHNNAILLDNILHHLLHFVPPEAPDIPVETTAAEFEEPSEARPPAAIDRFPDPSAARETPAHPAAEHTMHRAHISASPKQHDDAPPLQEPREAAEKFAAPAAHEDNEYRTEFDPNEADESHDRENAYN